MSNQSSEKNLKIVSFFNIDQTKETSIAYAESLVSAGFPSTAENFSERSLDLNDLLIKHPISTFYIRVLGDSMINAGINSNDILIVDRALSVSNNKIAVVRINNDFTVKRIKFAQDKILLMAENDHYTPIEITQEMDFEIWGIVTYVIHKV